MIVGVKIVKKKKVTFDFQKRYIIRLLSIRDVKYHFNSFLNEFSCSVNFQSVRTGFESSEDSVGAKIDISILLHYKVVFNCKHFTTSNIHC